MMMNPPAAVLGGEDATEHVKTSRPRKFVTLCGRVFRNTNPAYFPRVEYRGRTILLCTDACLGAFCADPDVFYKAHRNSEKHKNVATR